MRNLITYEQISPLVKHVEIAADMIHCHFHCPVKSKKIVAITRLSKHFAKKEETQENLISSIKHYFNKSEELIEHKDPKMEKESAVIHAFGKISERFVWSEPHNHFIYRF